MGQIFFFFTFIHTAESCSKLYGCVWWSV